MLLEIDLNLYKRLSTTLKDIDKNLYSEFIRLLPIEKDITKARVVKTQRVKLCIKETIKSLYNQNITPTKYKINKLTGISFITLNKYYDDILQEVKNEIRA